MKTILVLEDDPGNMQVFCALLGSKGFRVLEATTGQEAIEISSNELGSIDLLVSDLRLPDLAGTEVALRLIESQGVALDQGANLGLTGQSRLSGDTSCGAYKSVFLVPNSGTAKTSPR